MAKKPTFQKRHYVAIAKLLKDQQDAMQTEDRRWIIMALSHLFSADNPAFEPSRFYKAADYDSL